MNSVQENVDLLHFNTFKVPAFARFFAEFKDTASVEDFLKSDLLFKCPHFVLGGGSNVLFTGDFDGLIIHPVMRGIELIEENSEHVLIKVAAGENWDEFVEYSVNHKHGGIENLSWIPGFVGACPVQNIGAYGTEIMDFIHSVEGYFLDTGKKFSIPASECKFSYRNSIFKNELKNKILITHVLFRLLKNPDFNTEYPDLKKEMEKHEEINLDSIRNAIIEIRKRKLPDPSDMGNAGSFFKNPVVTEKTADEIKSVYPDLPVYRMNNGFVKLPAAWLIEQCGLKGKTYGNTGTHDRQPLIVINRGGASGNEILRFANEIQKSVKQQFGVMLETEVNIL